jgi:hypothetical protein
MIPLDQAGEWREIEMYTVKWIERGKESEPVEIDESIHTDLDRIVYICKDALYGVRLRHFARPPDGFIVVDHDGQEVRRWVDSRRSNAGAPDVQAPPAN